MAGFPDRTGRAGATILKFGGTSVEDAAAFARMASISAGRREQLPVVVASAMTRVTNTLVACARVGSRCELNVLYRRLEL